MGIADRRRKATLRHNPNMPPQHSVGASGSRWQGVGKNANDMARPSQALRRQSSPPAAQRSRPQPISSANALTPRPLPQRWTCVCRGRGPFGPIGGFCGKAATPTPQPPDSQERRPRGCSPVAWGVRTTPVPRFQAPSVQRRGSPRAWACGVEKHQNYCRRAWVAYIFLGGLFLAVRTGCRN